MEEGKIVFKILTDNHREKIHLGNPRSRCEDNIRIYLK
jgi:hypothetical protein